MKNRECKRCGLLESTVLATETKCIPDRRMGTVLEGVHDFISECGCPTKYCKHYESDFDKYIKTKMTFNSKRIGIKHMKPKQINFSTCKHLFSKAFYVDEKLKGYTCNSCKLVIPVSPQFQKRTKSKTK